MSTFTVEYIETTIITRTVEAATVEEAIAISENIRETAEDPWGDCDETTLGTEGVNKVFDAAGKAVYE